MLNIILDGFPDEYEGYLIRTDFRIGMQISEALNDVDLAEPEKMSTALRLLFGSGIPADIETAQSGLHWFMSGGNVDEEHVPDGKPPTFDFEQDNRLVYSAFRARYGIDLTRERLHWFAFLAMLGDLGGCSLSDIIGIRGTDLSKLGGEQRRHYAEMQAKYRIKPQLSEADRARIAEFEAMLEP
ncbi:MAG: bacteriophage Gp15 family protein [Lachnospiraceae bacterium]|nr:bacteriophage Gp15 family protein [Ruminococcus sp.]MCM1277086.1 bacteriophage Gp15 family protein [Lachnospiraceae bacterium]